MRTPRARKVYRLFADDGVVPAGRRYQAGSARHDRARLDIVAASGAPTSAAYNAIDRLTDAGIITEITGRKRDRVWAATDALGELDELDRRIQASMTQEFTARRTSTA